MSLKLVPYSDIIIKDLPSIKKMLLLADVTEFISDGRAKILDYEKHIYIQYKEKYIGYFGIREIHHGEFYLLDDFIGKFAPEEFMVIAPIFILPEFQGIGVGRNVMKKFYEGKKGIIWIDEENIASRKMAEYAGFIHYNDGYYIKSL